MRETPKNVYSDSTEDYRENYDKIDWTDNTLKVVEREPEKNPNDRTHIWNAHIRRWFVGKKG